jgi:hypothetical protein
MLGKDLSLGWNFTEAGFQGAQSTEAIDFFSFFFLFVKILTF